MMVQLKNKKNKILIISCICLIVCVMGTTKWIKATKDVSHEEQKIIVAIDAGHGGFDPGKVGVNQAIEKDINLSIAQKLKEILKADGFEIVMTRESDEAVHSEGESTTTKRSDMRSRVARINESGAKAAISIHQNSFTDGSSHGAQVFYHPQSEEGKNMALVLQAKIKEIIADDNHREAKANESYYMLKKTECPLVIVECGFLSNEQEANLLMTEEYQKKMAEAISQGLKKYLDTLT
ncbi:MAG: N-acetylmuramoyl-L-alanine amidase [Velocimicrobium sp.]